MVCRLVPLCAVLVFSAFACSSASAQQPQQPGPDVLRTGYIQQMDGEFRRRDGNGDGRITRDEMTAFELDLAVKAARAKNAELFARLDADRNGLISAAEFAGLIGEVPTPDVTPLMQRFDGNRDQMVTLVEYRAATLINFDRLDTDLDGVLTPAEIRAGARPPAPASGR